MRHVFDPFTMRATQAGTDPFDHLAMMVSFIEDCSDSVNLRFEVKDTGIGIPENRKVRLFKSFSQVDASTTRRFGGTGLGLAISKKLTQLMGGEIGVDSREGKGSTFWFTAVFERQAVSDDDEQRLPAHIPDKRVLVVDHQQTHLEDMGTYLRSWECRYSTALNATKALRLMQQAQSDGDAFDLVLIDQAIPEMDGKALAMAVKASPNLAQTLLVLLTPCGMRGDAIRMKKAGYHAYLQKPVSPSMLFDCLATLFDAAQKTASDKGGRMLVTRHSIKAARFRKRRILLAEDDHINRQVALKMLENFGCVTETAKNGREALELLETQPFDLVLMDVQMPEMDGKEATGIIRSSASKALDPQIPIIAMTAHAMKGDREACIKTGMNDYISKPVDPDELFEKLGTWMPKK